MKVCDQDFADEAANAMWAEDAPAEVQARADSLQMRRKVIRALILHAQKEIKLLLADDPDACYAPKGYDWGDVEALLDDFASMDQDSTADDVDRLLEE